jgi:3-deoxy-D-manno-octulosonate 8-phosphate phosphatase (KDO 8-P phosphatase)
MTPQIFLLDVDGVMTTGHFLYDANGKAFKLFGPHDADGLKNISSRLQIRFITADVRGFEISRKRIVEDMGYQLEIVSESDRVAFVERLGPEKVIYMGDGFYDAKVLKICAFGIVPANARREAKYAADFVTESKSGEGAVLDACIEIEKKFFSGNDQQFSVCILAAGRGTRMGEFTKYFNKALLPINKKSAICHVIDSYQINARVIVALGYLGEMLRVYLENAYPDRDIVFVNVDNYEGQGSGPGYSLLACKKYLNTPFILANVDALTIGDIPPPNQNWLGVSPVDDTSRFCSVRLGNSREILALDDKVKTNNKYAFTGIAGINDYQIFLDALEKNKLEINGEKQVSGGFEALINHGLKAHIFEWYDVGTLEAYGMTRKKYEKMIF